jgi:hypothetical protein
MRWLSREHGVLPSPLWGGVGVGAKNSVLDASPHPIIAGEPAMIDLPTRGR